jgi:YHS domain-containing protein
MDKKAQWSLVAAAWVLAIGVIAMGILALQRFGSAPAANPAPLPSPQASGNGKQYCPVDHVEVVVGPDTPKVRYNGNTYYFCDTKDSQGRSHKELFLMDPQLYLSGVSSYAPNAAPESTSAAPVSLSKAAGLPLPESPSSQSVTVVTVPNSFGKVFGAVQEGLDPGMRALSLSAAPASSVTAQPAAH